jgi:hypothetical protein
MKRSRAPSTSPQQPWIVMVRSRPSSMSGEQTVAVIGLKGIVGQ